MASSSTQPVLPPLLEQVLAAPADPQAASPFFARLPIEIRRMIYVEVWRTYGAPDAASEVAAAAAATDSPDHSEWWWRTHGGSLTVHIAPVLAATGPGSDGFTSAPCFLGVDDDDESDNASPATAAALPPEARDIRVDRLNAARASADSTALVLRSQHFPIPSAAGPGPGSGSAPPPPPPPPAADPVPLAVWQTRLHSPWLAHWPCEAHFTGASDPASRAADRRRAPRPPRPFLPVLQTCRRAYAEAGPLLYRALTFQFTDRATALAFVRRWPAVAAVRLVLRLPGGGGSSSSSTTRTTASVVQALQTAAWHELVARLADPAAMPHLRRLRIWVETAPPAAYRAADERWLFAPLLNAAHLLARRAVVLYLPSLPDKHADRDMPRGRFLGEDDDPDDDTHDAGPASAPRRPVHQPIVVRTLRRSY